MNSEISTSSDKNLVAIRLSTLSTNTIYMIKKEARKPILFQKYDKLDKKRASDSN